MNISVKKPRPVTAVYMYRHFRAVRNTENRAQYYRCVSTSSLASNHRKAQPLNAPRSRPASAPADSARQVVNSRPSSHTKARSSPYPRNPNLNRYPVPEDKVPWDVEYAGYDPVDYTAASVASKPVWADPDFKSEEPAQQPKWNTIDGAVDRSSYTGRYQIVHGVPRNPIGRSGMCSRGMLGKWGPNHAADPIVTRWKRDDQSERVKHADSGKPVLQFVCVQRKDSGEWALPGGMVDAGDNVSVTLKKEFAEEAMNCLEASERDLAHIEQQLEHCFQHGIEVYKGYVDDPRNTDNAWMETIAVNFHDEAGDGAGKFHLHAGDDAGEVMWADLDQDLKLYASHQMFICEVAKRHHCHW